MRSLPSFRGYLRQVYSALRDTSQPPPAVPPVFSGDYSSWQAASAECGCYDAAEIFEKTKAAALAVRNGKAAFERDSVLFEKPEYRLETLAAVFWQAARDRGSLSVLDFGGSLGSVYYQSRAFLDELPSVKWGVVEQSQYVEYGSKVLTTDALAFFPDVGECVSTIQPNVAFLGCVLQYLPSPYALLETILRYRISSIVFDRLSVFDQPKDRITIQRVPAEIYDASYPAWFFSENGFREFMESFDYELRAECRNVDHYPLDGVKTSFKGYHFVRRS